ncbi:MAG: TrkH family potassium uptake protein [Pseudomonadota bacterium]
MADRRGRGAGSPGFRIPPPLFLALIYAGLIMTGSALLMLPISQAAGASFHDVLFVATSAVTVTGLTVVDVGTAFSPFGQGVIAALVQIGGIGFMSFAVIILSVLGVSMGLTGRQFLREDLNQDSLRNLFDLARRIMAIALLVEAIGAMLLATVFVPQLGWAEGLWWSVFHAVSAFNNAGFSLGPDGLTPWVGDWRINLIIPTLFILGGLGYTVIVDVWRTRRWRSFSLHTKLMLTGSAGLIVFAFVLFALLEWSNPRSLAGLESTGDKLLASWFQAVTPRTAGFNTLEIDHLRDSTVVVMMCLMAVGGGSASTAGGIKVTTFVVLLLVTMAFLQRRTNVIAFRRAIGISEIFKVMAIVTLSFMVVILGIFALTVTHDHLDFLDLAFEVVSAFATVGLTHGLTAELDWIGRIILMVEMFIGRVGPLTIGFFLATRTAGRVRYPDARIQIG